MATAPIKGEEQAEKFTVEQVIAKGEGTVFKGAPNDGVCGGAEHSPELPQALNQ